MTAPMSPAALAGMLQARAKVAEALDEFVQLDPDVARQIATELDALVAAREETARHREALERIDAWLTTMTCDNIPRGESPKRHARQIARLALAGSSEADPPASPAQATTK